MHTSRTLRKAGKANQDSRVEDYFTSFYAGSNQSQQESGQGRPRSVELPLMLLPRLRSSRLFGVVAAVLMEAAWASAAYAWPWESVPQPLLENREAIFADAGSPLAWDNSSRTLWFVSRGYLNRAVWTGATFRQTEHSEKAAQEGGLLVDPGLHFVFFLSEDGRPRCFRKDQGKWSSVQIGTEPVQLLLGIDEKAHRLFAYDAAARGIRTYTYHRKSDDWRSELIVTGLGPAGDAGVMDAARGTIYTSHETADDGIPRAEGVELMEDPTGTGLLKPWPLVATSWDGNGWSSRVLAETGVPQQPGLRLPDRSLFFTVRWDFESVRVLRMRPGADAEGPTIWTETAGRETFADHPHYKIREPRYPPSLGGSLGGSMTMSDLLSEIPVPQIPLTPPIDIVPCFRPVWSEKRLSRNR